MFINVAWVPAEVPQEHSVTFAYGDCEGEECVLERERGGPMK